MLQQLRAMAQNGLDMGNGEEFVRQMEARQRGSTQDASASATTGSVEAAQVCGECGAAKPAKMCSRCKLVKYVKSHDNIAPPFSKWFQNVLI